MQEVPLGRSNMYRRCARRAIKKFLSFAGRQPPLPRAASAILPGRDVLCIKKEKSSKEIKRRGRATPARSLLYSPRTYFPRLLLLALSAWTSRPFEKYEFPRRVPDRADFIGLAYLG